MKSMSIKRYTIIACLSAISYLLMFLSFSIIPIVPFMKVDFSDIPILIVFFVLGVRGGFETAILRSLLYFLIAGPSISNLIGVSANLLGTLMLCLPIYYILRKKHNLKKYVLAVSLATLSLTFWLSLSNWLIITPLYMAVLGVKLTLPLNELILFGVVPFNIIKGLLIGILFIFVYEKMHIWLNKKASEFLVNTKNKCIKL